MQRNTRRVTLALSYEFKMLYIGSKSILNLILDHSSDMSVTHRKAQEPGRAADVTGVDLG